MVHSSRISKGRVEDPFQLVGMNALGLPGTSIDGMLGFTVLARFRLEIDLTKDHMTWTRLDYDPPDPPVPNHKPGDKRQLPSDIQAMNALGPIAKGLAFLIGKQPEEEYQFRGFLGLEWFEQVISASNKQVLVQRVLADLPAAHSGLRPGDQIIRINNHVIKNINDARVAMAKVRPGSIVYLDIQRGSGSENHKLRLTLTAQGGF